MNEQEPDLESLLRVGAAVLLQLDPQHSPRRFRTHVRGWQKPVHLILDRPRVDGRSARMQEGLGCAVRFLVEGDACGFSSSVLDVEMFGNASLCRIAWPDTFQLISFRKYKRTALSLPCTITISPDETRDGDVRDISIGGCGIATDREVAEGTEATLSFVLPDGTPVRNLLATVRSARAAHDGSYFLGCQFLAGQEHIQSDIAFFITAMLERTSTAPINSRRVLIIDGDGTTGTAVYKGLIERDCQAFIAPNAVEGLFRLRLLRPAALVVNQAAQDLPGLDVIRLVRKVPTLGSVPIFLYGGNEAEVAAKAVEAGIAAYFPPASDVNAICDAVANHATR